MSVNSLKPWPTSGFHLDEGALENGVDPSANGAEGQKATGSTKMASRPASVTTSVVPWPSPVSRQCGSPRRRLPESPHRADCLPSAGTLAGDSEEEGHAHRPGARAEALVFRLARQERDRETLTELGLINKMRTQVRYRVWVARV